MARFHFTSKAIESLKPNGLRVDYFDSSFRVRGINFGVRINAGGSLEYFVRYRDKYSKHRRMSLGDAKVMSLATARAKASQIGSDLTHGRSPAQELAQYKLAETVAELCKLYLDQHAKFKKDGGAEDWRMLIKDVIPKIGDFKACEVRRKDVIALIDSVAIERNAKIAANRLRSLLSKLFNFALERELIDASPCAGLPKKTREKSKERVLSEAEIRELWHWLDTEPTVNAAIIRLILLTGQRPMEVARMEWSELKGNIWEIPGLKTKNGRAHMVPLSRLALREIELIAPLRKDRFLFSGERGEHVKARTLQHVSERFHHQLKTQKFTPHDLRRTAATYLRKLGVSREVVGRLLNHTQGDVTAVYDRHDLLPEIREGLVRWSEEIARVAGIVEPEIKIRTIGGRSVN